jgi:hypothetical protein
VIEDGGFVMKGGKKRGLDDEDSVLELRAFW